jgi:thiamine-phosphate pyrophosphorylase
MFAFKNRYYLLIENTKDIQLNNTNLTNKFTIIYRNNKKPENINDLLRFRKICKSKRIEFFVANNVKLLHITRADGLYISANNRNLNLSILKKSNYKIIGSFHNLKELNIKTLQGCSEYIFSRLFKTSYKFKSGYLGIIKFNFFKNKINKNLTPLGGIKVSNLNKLKLVKCQSVAFLSEVKKKPANLFSRLF